MKLEEQIISLELAQQLKELGVKQESLFEWSIETRKRDGEKIAVLMGGTFGVEVNHQISWRVYDFEKRETFSAFTVAELGEMLPKEYENEPNEISPLEIAYGENGWWVRNGTYSSATHGKYDKRLTNAMAKMLIYLIENKLMELTTKKGEKE